MAAARAAGWHGGYGDHGGRSAIIDSDRRRIVGVLCSMLVLATLGGVLIQVYLLLTFTSIVKNPDYCIAYNCLCAQETPFGLPKFARMSKLSDDTAKDSERYKTLGFKSQFDGKPAGMPWAELIEELKTNVLRQPLRVRKLIMGECDTTPEAGAR